MLIHLIKFIHLAFALSLIATTFYCIAQTIFPKINSSSSAFIINSANKFMLLSGLVAMLTGTFLVYPKHYNFATAWIQAAYFLLLVVGAIITALMYSKKQYKIITAIAYLAILIILSFIVHDAVRKTTFIQFN